MERTGQNALAKTCTPCEQQLRQKKYARKMRSYRPSQGKQPVHTANECFSVFHYTCVYMCIYINIHTCDYMWYTYNIQPSTSPTTSGALLVFVSQIPLGAFGEETFPPSISSLPLRIAWGTKSTRSMINKPGTNIKHKHQCH